MTYIKFTRRKSLALLRLKESGMPVTELCKKQKISRATFYNWMTTLRIQALEKENIQLKKEILRLKPKSKTPTIQTKLEKDDDQEFFETIATIIADIILNNNYNNPEEFLKKLKKF